MSKQVIIIGAGGHGRVVADIVRCAGDQVIGFLDDGDGLPEQISGLPFLGGVENYVNFPEAEFLVAIGNPRIREQITERLAGVKWHTAIHPAAVVSRMETSVGAGTVIMAGAVVNPGAVIGRHCIVNTCAVVEHDDHLEDYVHISVGARLGGLVRVGKGSWIGIGAVVSNCVNVCEDCMIGAGAAVVQDIVNSGTYVGVPARKKK